MLVKLKCNKDHIHGLNWVLANKVKKLKIHYMDIIFLQTKQGRSSKMIFYCFQLDMKHNLLAKLLQKLLNEKSLLFSI